MLRRARSTSHLLTTVLYIVQGVLKSNGLSLTSYTDFVKIVFSRKITRV